MPNIFCTDIVEMHGGSLYVTSQGEGYGCTFTIELPITITTTVTTTTTTTADWALSEYHDLEVNLSDRERGNTYSYLIGPDAPPYSSKSMHSLSSLPHRIIPLAVTHQWNRNHRQQMKKQIR